jgi:hypothetical protein
LIAAIPELTARPGNPALHRCHALFEHVVSWIHYAAVDIARHSEVEEIGAMLCIVELVSDGLINGYCDRLSCCIGCIACVDSDGFFFHAERLLM